MTAVQANQPTGRAPRIGGDALRTIGAVGLAFGVVAGSQQIGPLGADASTLVGALAVSAALPIASGVRDLRWAVAVGVVAAACLVRIGGGGDAFVCAASVIALLVGMIARDRTCTAAVTVAPLAAYTCLLALFPELIFPVVSACEWLSSALSGERVILGATAIGLPVAFALGGAGVALGRGIAERLVLGVFTFVGTIGLGVVMHAQALPPVYQWLFQERVFGISAQWANGAAVGMFVPAALFAVSATALMLSVVVSHRARPRAARASSEGGGLLPRPGVVAAACGLAAAATLVVSGLGGEDLRAQGRRVYFVPGSLADFNTPDYERFSLAQLGMFGLLRDRVDRIGFEVVEVSSPVEVAEPRVGDVFFLINPESASEADVEAFRSFVAAGGIGLMLGDHTDIMNTKGPTNAYLAPFGVWLERDSAFPAASTWNGAFAPPRSSLLSGLGTSNIRVQHGTGASISINRPFGAGELGPARPLMIARYAFSDHYDPLKRRGDYRGDYRYVLGEELGDRVVGVERRYGDGIVRVFADTSAFQNLSIGWSWPKLRRALRTEPDEAFPLWVRIALLVGVVAAVGFFSWRVRSFGPVLVGVACASAIIATGVAVEHAPPVSDPLIPDDEAAVVDLRWSSGVTLEHWRAESVSGLLATVARAGFVAEPVGPGEGSPRAVAGLRVIPNPGLRIDRGTGERWLRSIEESGGTLVLAIGGDSRAASSPLLETLGVKIDASPLGPLPIRPKLGVARFAQAMLDPQFTEAFALRFDDPSVWRPRYAHEHLPVIAERSWGAGRVVVIGDGRFLHDRTLESETEAWIGNVKLLGGILEGENGHE